MMWDPISAVFDTTLMSYLSGRLDPTFFNIVLGICFVKNGSSPLDHILIGSRWYYQLFSFMSSFSFLYLLTLYLLLVSKLYSKAIDNSWIHTVLISVFITMRYGFKAVGNIEGGIVSLQYYSHLSPHIFRHYPYFLCFGLCHL